MFLQTPFSELKGVGLRYFRTFKYVISEFLRTAKKVNIKGG